MFEPFVGEQIGQLLSNRLNQLGIRDVVVDETRDVVYVPWEEDRMSHLEEQLKSKMIPKYQ